MKKNADKYGSKNDELLIAKGVPNTREDCAGIERPCPHLNCQYHLWRDVNNNGKVIFNFEKAEKIRQISIDVLKKNIEKKETKYEIDKSERLRRSIQKSRRILKRKLEKIPESCALDIAEDGENSINRIAVILGMKSGDLKRLVNMAVMKLLCSKGLSEGWRDE